MRQKKITPDKLVNNHYFNVSLVLLTLFFLFPANLTVSTNAQTLTLEQCIDTALLYNRSLLLSSQDILIMEEKRKEVNGNLLPRLNASADYRYYTDLPYQLMPASVFGGPPDTYKEVQFGVPQSFAASLQLNVPVVNASVIGALKTARIAEEMTSLQHIKTEEEVRLDVSQTYYNAQILLSQISFTDTNIINMERLRITTRLLYEQLLAKGSDVDRVQLQLDQLKSRRATLYAQYRQVTNVLEFMMGKPFSDNLEVQPAASLFVEKKYLPGDITELKLMEKKLQLNRSELNGLRFSRLPSISGYAMYGTTGLGTTGENSFFNFYPVGFVGMQLTVPLFNGTVTRHRINQKKIELEKSSLQHEMAIEKNRMESENANRQYLAAKEFVSTTTAQTELADKIYHNTILQNKQGVASLTDVLAADTSLREAQQNYFAALISLFKAELELQRVTGNLIKK